MGAFTKPLLSNLKRGKAWLETLWRLLMHGITQIRERDAVRDTLLGMRTPVFCCAAASPSWPSPTPASSSGSCSAGPKPIPGVGDSPKPWRPSGSHQRPARRQRGWKPLCPPAPLHRQHGLNPDVRDKVGNARDNVQTCDKATWPSERGRGPFSSSFTLHFKPLESFPFLDVKLSFSAFFYFLVSGKGLVVPDLPARWDSGLWLQSPASAKEMPARTKVEHSHPPCPSEMPGAPSPGDAAQHFHSKALRCHLATFSRLRHFRSFLRNAKRPVRFPDHGRAGREPPMAPASPGEGQLPPPPRHGVGAWGDMVATGESATGKRPRAASPRWPRLHACLCSRAPPGLSALPPHGQAGDQHPDLEPPAADGGGLHPEGQRDTGHPTPHHSFRMKISAHVWAPKEASHLPSCEDNLLGPQPGQNQLGVVSPNIEEVITIHPGRADLPESSWGSGRGKKRAVNSCA